MSGGGPREISPLGWDCAVRLSPVEGRRSRANGERRLRSVSCEGDGCKETLWPLSCWGIRTSGVVGSQWLGGLGWRSRIAFAFFEMSQDFPNHVVLGDEGADAIGTSEIWSSTFLVAVCRNRANHDVNEEPDACRASIRANRN